MTRVEFDQYIDIAVGPEIIPEDRAEQRQLVNVVTTAESGQPFPVDRKLVAHTGSSSQSCSLGRICRPTELRKPPASKQPVRSLPPSKPGTAPALGLRAGR